MSDQFVAEIRIFPYNFAPTGWAFCQGQLMPISQNTALFSLLGTQYGGDGKSTFGLPNLQGRVAIHQGQGSGLSPRFVGETSGSDTVTLLTTEIPVHNHATACNTGNGNAYGPANDFWAKDIAGGNEYAPAANAQMAPQALAPVGGSQPHNNLQPYLVMNYFIALQGVFPPRG
jgi:microcystin-dependent protein